jgi:uncharacterized membrane protein
LPLAVVFDLVAWVSGNLVWSVLATYAIGTGIVGGLVAAVFGLIDWLAIPRGTRARAVGAWHGLGNVVVLTLFAVSWGLRVTTPDGPAVWPSVFAIAGLGLALVTGWLGGELVVRLGVGVDPDAHLDAPSSLSEEPADHPFSATHPRPGVRVR